MPGLPKPAELNLDTDTDEGKEIGFPSPLPCAQGTLSQFYLDVIILKVALFISLSYQSAWFLQDMLI